MLMGSFILAHLILYMDIVITVYSRSIIVLTSSESLLSQNFAANVAVVFCCDTFLQQAFIFPLAKHPRQKMIHRSLK